MSVGFVLRLVGNKIGVSPDEESGRSVLLRFFNEAAIELYEQADMEGTLVEQVFHVDGDQQIAFPPTVGPIRAMREYSTHVPWHLVDMRPRYNQFNWSDRWRNWRLKGVSPLSYPLVNQAPIKVRISAIETPPIVISVSGPTTLATSINEQFTMDALEKQSANNFTDFTFIKKDRVNTVDVQVLDADNNVLCAIPNNMLQMRYRIVDVSLYPWSNTDTTTGTHYMEVLYKKALPWFQNDDDEYPAPDCDHILTNKMLQLWAEEQGKGEEAIAYDAKATRSLARKREESNRAIEQKASFCEHPHDTLLPRNRPMGPSRYSGQIYY